MIISYSIAMWVTGGILTAGIFLFFYAAKIINQAEKTGCLLMFITPFLCLAMVIALVHFTMRMPVYIACEKNGKIRYSRNLKFGEPIFLMKNGTCQPFKSMTGKSILINNTQKILYISEIKYSSLPYVPFGPGSDSKTEKIEPFGIYPLTHKIDYFNSDNTPDHVDVEKGTVNCTRYEIWW